MLEPGYRFDTTVSIGDAVATTVTGRVHHGSSELRVTAAGTTVDYLAVPPRAWARKKGGTWQELDTAVPAANPLDALRSPASIDVQADGDAGLRVVAAYPAAALGVPGSGPLQVTLLIAPDGTVSATYTASTSAGNATSRTTFRADPGGAPITAPAGPSASPPA